MDMQRTYAIYLFDLDDTLISGYMRNPDKAYHQWEVLPGRVETLRDLVANGKQIGVVTNQGAVGLSIVSAQDFEDKIARVQRALGGVVPRTSVAVCFSGPRQRDPRRKPSGAMICELMTQLAYGEDRARKLGVLYVGDRDEDRAAAQDAGVDFMWAKDFFTEEPA